MRKYILFAILALLPLSLLLTSCSQCSTKAEVGIPYSPYVEAFTHGDVPRTTPVYLIFNRELAPQMQSEEALKRAMKIKPSVAGKFSIENDRTVVFRPESGYERNKTYRVSADMGYLFDAEREHRDFAFSFSTLPMALRAGFESLEVSEKEKNAYNIVCNIYTPDSEQTEEVKALVSFSEVGDGHWESSTDGKQHKLTLRNVTATKQVRVLDISVARNRMGVPVRNLLSVYVPSVDEFGLYDINYISEPERYIEATFTKNLDADQQMRGLAYIENNGSERVSVEKNRLRLYPDAGAKGSVRVKLSGMIKNTGGVTLGKDVERDIEVSVDIPAVRFANEGVIVPQSTQVLIPFQAVYLRGVVVRVIKIAEQNIGQFLQVNTLQGNDELIRVGQLVARKTIFLDEAGEDLAKWNTYAIDLKQLIEPEQGAIYRVELSFNKDLSAYPCDNSEPIITKEQLLADDEIKLKEETNRFEQGGYYYYFDQYYNWYDYDYNERDNPCTSSFYMSNTTNVGRNVLATNLGVIAKAGKNGEMLVMVHNLLSTQPETGVKVDVFNYQNRVMGGGVTDQSGQVKLTLEQGRPYYLIATQGNQRSYLRVDDNMALSLSSFDVSGQVVQKGLKGFIYGDRGVWRPGDMMYLSFMLNDVEGRLPADHPVVMELYNPLGQLYSKKNQSKGAMGLYAFSIQTEQDAPTGAWEVKVHVGGVTFSKRVRVETIKPNRLKIDLSFGDGEVIYAEQVVGKLHVEWMQGAVARNLKYEMEASLYSTPTKFKGFEKYTFDDPLKRFDGEKMAFAKGNTDGAGDATITGKINTGVNAPGMLMASFDSRVYEESGDFSIDALRVPFSPYKQYVGIESPQKGRSQLITGTNNKFELASVDYNGKPIGGTQLNVSVYKIYWYWWWSSNQDRLASYISEQYNDRVKNLTLKTNSEGKVSFDLNFSDSEWGTYYISATDTNSGHSTGIVSYFDWASMTDRRSPEGSDGATKLTFTTNKKSYEAGEKMTITVPSSERSRAVVSIENGSRVVNVSEHECVGGETQIQVMVTKEMMPNAYVHISLLQPHGMTLNDLPIRLYGVVPIEVTAAESYLHPILKAPEEIRPEGKYEITVSEKSGKAMAYTIAIVDEGLLDLTRFKTPDPWSVFNAHEALGVNTWDMYDYVVGAYGGRIEQLFSIGGDGELESGPKAIVSRFKPVVKFEGPFVLKKGGRQKHSYDMPNYSGRVRMMVIAGDGKAYGSSEKSVMVRKPVMLIGTLPRVIGVDEEMVIPATVFATKEGVGSVKVSISCSDNMQVMGATAQELNFKEVGDKQTKFRIKVGSISGAGKVTLTAVSANDKSTYETDIEIRSVRRPVTVVSAATIKANENWTQNVTLPGGVGTNSLSLEISNVQPLNLASRISFLLGYPHGCIEQITSRGFPQLYLTQFASLTKEQTDLSNAAVQAVLSRYKSYQTVDGAFAYWPGGTSSNAWGSVYAAHFILEAEAKGFYVQEQIKTGVLNQLRLVARNWKPSVAPYGRSEEMTQAYRLYVLALAKSPEIGAMNRMKESGDLAVMSRWTLAGAYAEAGRADVGKELVGRTVGVEEYRYGEYDYTFGSGLRDKALRLLTLVAMNDAGGAAELTNQISKELSSDSWLSTQSTGFALVALSKYFDKYKVAEKMEFAYNADGTKESVKSNKNVWLKELFTKYGKSVKLEVQNSGEATLFMRLIATGTPEQGEERAYANGVAIDVLYVDSNNAPVNIKNLDQGANFTAIVVVRNPSQRAFNNIILSQIFPAGWEILNTRFTDESASNSFPLGISYQDIRDDRVYSHIDRLESGKQVTVRINLAAAYAGSFYCPPVYAEAMYDNLISANTEGMQVLVRD